MISWANKRVNDIMLDIFQFMYFLIWLDSAFVAGDRVVSECNMSLCWSSAVVQPRTRAGTGRFAAIFCPTKQPSEEGNQPGLHCRFVPGSGQWLLTDFSLPRMEMSVTVWFFYLLSKWMRTARREVSRTHIVYNDYLSFRPRPSLSLYRNKEQANALPAGANCIGWTAKTLSLNRMLLNTLKTKGNSPPHNFIFMLNLLGVIIKKCKSGELAFCAVTSANLR